MKNDNLQKLLNLQDKLQEKLGTYDSIEDESDKQKYINQNVLAMLDELTEIMNETEWKNPDKVKFGWKKSQEFNEEKFKNEIIDMFHFIFNLCNIVEMGSTEIAERYISKRETNLERKNNDY